MKIINHCPKVLGKHNMTEGSISMYRVQLNRGSTSGLQQYVPIRQMICVVPGESLIHLEAELRQGERSRGKVPPPGAEVEIGKN